MPKPKQLLSADDLYKRAMRGKGEREHGLSNRTRNALARAGYCDGKNEIKSTLLYREVLSGEILAARGIGKKALREICEWLANTGNDTLSER